MISTSILLEIYLISKNLHSLTLFFYMFSSATKLSRGKLFKQQYSEPAIWIIALVALYFMQSDTGSPSLCFFNWIGISHCPGCGLGHSIHAALRLQLSASLQYHPLGIIAVLIISNRIVQLTFKLKKI